LLATVDQQVDQTEIVRFQLVVDGHPSLHLTLRFVEQLVDQVELQNCLHAFTQVGVVRVRQRKRQGDADDRQDGVSGESKEQLIFLLLLPLSPDLLILWNIHKT
jgi:hypothetical protein